LQYNTQKMTEKIIKNIRRHIIEHFHSHPECYYDKCIEVISYETYCNCVKK